MWSSWREERDEVTFTVGDATIEAKGGRILVLSAGVPHTFVNSGKGRAKHIDTRTIGHVTQTKRFEARKSRLRKRRDRLTKLGVQLNSFDWNGETELFGATLANIAQAAEESGFDRIAVADHVWQHPIMGGPEANEPECYAMLTFIVAHTERLGLGAMVSGVHFRHPAVLVMTVTTLDILSSGRAWLGIGSGHDEEEARGLGIPFSLQRERFEMLEEAVQITLRMWSGERGDERPFEGEHYRLERPLNLPQSLTRPHPPDRDRRRGRAEDPAPGRPLRRRLQPASEPGDSEETRRVAPALRG